MTDFVEYNKYVNTRKKFSIFYETFIGKSREANIIIPFLKDSFQHVDPSDKKYINNLNLLTINNFSRLQAEALRCKIYNTEVLKTNYTALSSTQSIGPTNSNNRTKGLINFTIDNDDIVNDSTGIKSQFTNETTDANTYVIRKNQPKIDLLYSTLKTIDIFIDILEAYKSFINFDINKDIDIIDNILIVDKKSRPGNFNDNNHGFYLKKKTSQNAPLEHVYPGESVLFLSIKSFYLIGNDAKKTFDEKIEVVTSNVTDTQNIFNLDRETIKRNSNINGINIKKVVNDMYYNGDIGNIAYLDDISLNAVKTTHTILSNEILKHFINYIFLIKRNDRNILINALLNYYKIMKCYLLKSVTVGNILFNSEYKHSQGTTTDSTCYMLMQSSASENGSVAINPIIKENIMSPDNLIIPNIQGTVSTTNNYWKEIIKKNEIINNKIESLKIEIELSINNNDFPKVSDQNPILFKGFSAVKIDDERILIKFIDTSKGFGSTIHTAFNSNTQPIFPLYSIKYYPGLSHESLFYINNKIRNDLTSEELYLNDILQKTSDERIKSDIINQYQLEINRRLYKIVDVNISNDGIYNKIDNITIKARFEYEYNHNNNIDFLTLERNTYEIFDDKTNVIQTDTLVSPNGKIKLESSIDGKTIILYNFSNIHPNSDNIVIMNKSVDHKDKKANNISDLREVNKKILLNEMKINNSGRLYEKQDNKYNILNNQLYIYYVIVAIIIAIIVIINVSNMEEPLIKTVTTGCFSVIVFLFISYYMINILYIEGFSNIENFNSMVVPFTYSSGANELSEVPAKVSNIQGTMTSLEFDISRLFDILSVSIPQTNFVNTNNMLNDILESEKNDKIYVNDNLKHSKINAYNHIDVKKYEIINIHILIKAFLYTSLVIFGLYTLQLYIDVKYLDILIFISAILLIIIFTYYIVYSNVIVRTISKNKYWGKEYEDSYK